MFVEFTDVWSRRDIRTFAETSGSGYFQFISAKITAVHLEDVNGQVVDDPSGITEDFVDNLRWEVFQWFSSAPSLVMRQVMNLGEATRRSLFDTPEEPAPQQQTP